jgi:hypothetical protein
MCNLFIQIYNEKSTRKTPAQKTEAIIKKNELPQTVAACLEVTCSK